MKGIFIGADDTVSQFEFDKDTALEIFQGHVGGYIEDCPQNFNSRITMYCDEDGKRKNKPLNRLATFLSGLYPQGHIVGDVVIVGAADDEGNEQGVPDEVFEAVNAIDILPTWEKHVAYYKEMGWIGVTR